MNREIKFRAWDKTLGMMLDDLSIPPTKWLNSWLKTPKLYGPNGSDYVIMQYTGLKDKNGKEIYEGDVVRLHCSSNPDHALEAVIEWEGSGAAKFVPRIIHKMVWNEHRKKEVSAGEMHSYVGLHSCFSFPRYMEVIGNIYENPELLTDKQQ